MNRGNLTPGGGVVAVSGLITVCREYISLTSYGESARRGILKGTAE